MVKDRFEFRNKYRLSRISRSNLELIDVSIVKSESEIVCLEK